MLDMCTAILRDLQEWPKSLCIENSIKTTAALNYIYLRLKVLGRKLITKPRSNRGSAERNTACGNQIIQCQYVKLIDPMCVYALAVYSTLSQVL